MVVRRRVWCAWWYDRSCRFAVMLAMMVLSAGSLVGIYGEVLCRRDVSEVWWW